MSKQRKIDLDDPNAAGNQPIDASRREWLKRKAAAGTELLDKMQKAMDDIAIAHREFAILADSEHATGYKLLRALNESGRKSQALLDIMLGDDAPQAFPDIFAALEGDD